MLPLLLKRSLHGRRINVCPLFFVGFLDALKIALRGEWFARVPSMLATARNLEPSMAIHSPRIRP